jgi:hypothetical protein
MSFAKSPPLVVSAAVLVLMLVRVTYFCWSDDVALIGVIPDDAFYYIQLARHRVADGFWTFDGETPATGFHLLYGYFLATLFSIFGDIGWRQLFLVVGLLASVSIALSALFTCRTVEAVLGRKVVPIAAIPFFSWQVLVQSTAMVESWLVMLFSALTAYSLTKDTRSTAHHAAALVALGFLGSVARSDYGMLPGVLFCVFLIRSASRNEEKNMLNRSALILAGAIVGVTVVVLHNYYIAGHFAQASAQVKLHWSVIEGHNMWNPMLLIAGMLLTNFAFLDLAYSFPALILLWMGLTLMVRAFILAVRKRGSASAPALVTSSLLTIIAYIGFYRHNAGSFTVWYVSNFAVPTAITLAFIAHFVGARKAFTFATVSGAYFVAGVLGVADVVWPAQPGLMHAGLFLKDRAPQSTYAAWNAGIISYFAEKPMINIDGLTNDEVFPFIATNKLLDYVKLKRIDYIVDYEVMMTDARYRIRGGYDEGRTDSCLRPIQPADGNFPQGFEGSRLMLIEVVPGCL